MIFIPLFLQLQKANPIELSNKENIIANLLMRYKMEFIGEVMGTFLLVLFGCGAVAVSILYDAYEGLLQVALAWGIGVTLAIYLTRHISCAHLNPAVTLAMVLSKRMKINALPAYMTGQVIGAFLAGLAIYLLLGRVIVDFESIHGIVRGTPASVRTARMFGDYYINAENPVKISLLLAMGAEAFGTFLLLLMVFSLTEDSNTGRPDNSLTPVFIGLTVTSIIGLIALLTQAGINPARDFGPRMVA